MSVTRLGISTSVKRRTRSLADNRPMMRKAGELRYTEGVLAATTKHGLKALFLLAEKPAGVLVPVEQVSRESGVPAAYLSKIMKALVRENVVRARKGARGGVCLLPQEKGLTVWDICVALGDPIASAQCMLNSGPCSRTSPCRLHHRWQAIVKETRDFLESAVVQPARNAQSDPRRRG